MRTSLGVKIGALAASLLVITALVVVLASSSIGSVSSDSKALSDGAVSVGKLGDAEAAFNLSRALAFQHALEPNAAAKASIESSLDAQGKRINADLAAVRPTLKDADDRESLANLTAVIGRFQTARDGMLQRSSTQGAAAAYRFATSDVTPLGNQVTAAFDKLGAHQLASTGDLRSSASSTASHAKLLVFILLLVAIAVAGAATFFLLRSIRASVSVIKHRMAMLTEHCVHDLRVGLQHIAKGDLTMPVVPVTPRIEKYAADELGQIARAVDAIRDDTVASVEAYNDSRASLGGMIAEMSVAAASVSAASQEMAATSEETGRAVGEIASAISDVATGAERQVVAVEGTRQRVDEVATASNESARSASETAESAARAREIADAGAKAVAHATEAMGAVRNASEQATEAIRGLGAKSDQIGGIVATIGGIAEQTNLLALNAAIEAARAGEQGRGFAVVAEEVRKLAEESQAAAASISTLISEIQAETHRAVGVVEEGATRTAQGTETVEEARASFEAIGASVSEVSAGVEQVAGALQQIAASTSQMRDEITEVAAVAEQSSASSEQVSASTEETSASTEQIAASAQELSRTASRLEELANRFVLATNE
jgi:methyl-accepting chemotaxis protein